MKHSQETKMAEERKYATVLRPLLAEEKDALREALRRDGLLTPLIRDQHGDLLDGHNREDLCAELGIEPNYQTVQTDDPVAWIKGFQKARRNLSREEMRQLIAEQIMDTPNLSNNAIAKIVQVSDHTVAKVRLDLVDNGKVENVVRLDTKGRVNQGRRSQVANVDQPEPSQKPVSNDAPAPIDTKSGRLSGVTENILHHCADDNEFYSVQMIVDKVDPDGSIGITAEQLMPNIRRMSILKGLRVETRPAAKGTKRYRFYRQDKAIGLSVLKTKFRPVIKYLEEEAQRPISHQSTVRFTTAAGLLIQLLRDLEAE